MYNVLQNLIIISSKDISCIFDANVWLCV